LVVLQKVIVVLSGAIRAIEIARDKNWRNIWLETASMMVLHAFKCLVPWEVRNGSRNFIVSHINREGNRCVV